VACACVDEGRAGGKRVVVVVVSARAVAVRERTTVLTLPQAAGEAS
jgi:hypothetical protein